jgi:ATP-dependent helicase/nuclease subunit B
VAWDDNLQEKSLLAAIASARPNTHRSALPPATECPAPRINATRLPEAISASAYNSLIGCPYQFHARYVLGLAKIDEVQEEVDKADYGTRVHDALSEFHRACPQVSELELHAAQQRLGDISRQAFQDLIAHDQASAWLARWLRWCRSILTGSEPARRSWRFVAAETDRAITVLTPNGRSLTCAGASIGSINEPMVRYRQITKPCG